MDAKDILGLPRTPLPEKKSQPKKESNRKPDGISREVYALTGGLTPLMPSLDSSHLKKPPPSNEKITWQWLPFTNSARKDSLQLYHWGRVVNGVPPTGDYSFAKYNKSVEAIKYTDEEYEQHLTDHSWTKQETDQLFDLCNQFDLRFVIIADRFPSSRSMEELKDRYYSVSRSILLARASNPADVAGHPLVKEPYNALQEKDRKRALSMVLSQTKHQEKKDSEVLAEAKKITESRMAARSTDESVMPIAENDIVEVTINHDDAVVPPSNVRIAPSDVLIADTASTMASLRMLPVYLRTYALEQMVQQASSTAGVRTIKRVEQTLHDLGINLKPRVPTKAVCAEHLELRKEILTLLNLQKHLQQKEAEGSAREGVYFEMPGTPKIPFAIATTPEAFALIFLHNLKSNQRTDRRTRMESLVQQRRRVAFSEQDSNRTATRRSLSFDGDNKMQRSWFHGQDNYEYDPKEMEYSAAVAAAAFAISSTEEAEADYGRKIKVERQRSMGRAKSIKEGPITRLGSFRSLSIKEERDPGESSNRTQGNQDQRVQQQESGFPAKRPSLSSSTMKPEQGKQYQRTHSMRREADVSGPDSWEKAQLRKINTRYEKMKSKVVAWEEAKKMKAKLHMERKRNELEMRTTKNMQHYQSKLVRIDMIASGVKEQLDEKRRKEEAQVKERVRHGGPNGRGSAMNSCFWCN
ncbi:SWR1-complex protein 4 [Linum perenne]